MADPIGPTAKKRQLRKRITELEHQNAQMQERIREWDRVRSKLRELYLELVKILDLPALPCNTDEPEQLPSTVREALIDPWAKNLS